MIEIPYSVKKALRRGRYRKNYKFIVHDGESTFTIDNNNLIKESVLIDERMSSGSELKFGLCEGSSLEFQYFGYQNIRGAEIQAFISVQYKNDLGEMAWYDIPMGWFTAEECPRQFSTGIYKVTAYNKLMSKYLDAKVNVEVEDVIEGGEDGSSQVSLYKILGTLLDGYSIERYEETKLDINWRLASLIDAVSPNFGIIAISSSSDGANWRYLHPVMGRLKLTDEDSSFDSNDYYKFSITLGIIKQRIREYMNSAQEDGATVNLSDYYISYGSHGWIPFDDYIQYDDSAQDTVGGFFGLQSSSYSYRLVDNFMTKSDVEVSDARTNFEDYLNVFIPVYYIINDVEPSQFDPSMYSAMVENRITSILQEVGDFISAFRVEVPEIGKMRFSSFEDMPDVTLRELQSAVYETVAQFGQLDRVTDLFSGVELNAGGEYPAETLYPANNLYPGGHALHPFPSEYQKLWTDTVGEQTFRYLIITYKTTETVSGQTQEVEKTLQRTVDEHGTTNYNMSDNWLFRNLIWTAADVGEYADAMVEKMRGIKWFPFEMWATGLPYVETGDAIEITDKDGDTHYSYILQRQLKGIHALQDTFINGELDVF